jgi:hypothetical protein
MTELAESIKPEENRLQALEIASDSFKQYDQRIRMLG